MKGRCPGVERCVPRHGAGTKVPFLGDCLTLPRSWALASQLGQLAAWEVGTLRDEVRHREETSLWPEGGRWCLILPGLHSVETSPWCSWWL